MVKVAYRFLPCDHDGKPREHSQYTYVANTAEMFSIAASSTPESSAWIRSGIQESSGGGEMRQHKGPVFRGLWKPDRRLQKRLQYGVAGAGFEPATSGL
jgi:hypothetical protein